MQKNFKQILKECSKMQRHLMLRKLSVGLIRFYQQYLSAITIGGCRYYPSCSEYAKMQFENNSLLSAFYHTLTRILRCNQLFDGGIEYPVLEKLSLKPTKLGVDSIKYWLVPNKQNRYFIIKNFSYKG